jgi:hypothetical protein
MGLLMHGVCVSSLEKLGVQRWLKKQILQEIIN